MPKQQKVAHKGTVAFETQTDQRANSGQSNEFLKQKTGRGLEGGTSGAADPDFEKKAEKFEMAFGAGAMKNGAVNSCVDSMMDQIANNVAAIWKTKQGEAEMDMGAELARYCGTRPDMKGVAGAVPADKVKAHMLDGAGNVRTKMTALYNFGRTWQKELQDLYSKGKVSTFVENLKAENGDAKTGALESRIEEMGDRKNARLTPTPRDAETTQVALQPSTRGEFGDGSQMQSTRTAEQVGLTKDEATFQGLDKDDSLQHGDDWESKRVLWEEGARKWLINEDNVWVAKMRELSLPLKAGPSGTTDRIMQTRELLGVSDAVSCRGACLAYLLPINAHSMVEIMEAAKPFGADFTPGPAMYHTLEPFGSLKGYAPDTTWWGTVEEAAGVGG